MAAKTIVIGDDDTVVKFKINGTEFECFPLDDIEFINEAAIPADGEKITGEAFCAICQKRLQDKYGVTASLLKASQWYVALHEVSKEQEAFFGESPASSAPTDSLPQAGVTTPGADENSATTNSACSNSLKPASGPKNNRKRSSTSTKNAKAAGTT